jgi:putative NADH-flavin reductase
MKLVVIGATGNIGRRIAAEALRRKHEVTGVVRDPAAVEPPDPRVRVGGAGSLEVAPGQVLADQQDFPDAYKAEAREGRESLAVWRTEAEGLDWTYLSPAQEIGPGERTGKYRATDDRLLADATGKSFISYEDYAVAVLDELEHPGHVGRRFGVAY